MRRLESQLSIEKTTPREPGTKEPTPSSFLATPPPPLVWTRLVIVKGLQQVSSSSIPSLPISLEEYFRLFSMLKLSSLWDKIQTPGLKNRAFHNHFSSLVKPFIPPPPASSYHSHPLGFCTCWSLPRPPFCLCQPMPVLPLRLHSGTIFFWSSFCIPSSQGTLTNHPCLWVLYSVDTALSSSYNCQLQEHGADLYSSLPSPCWAQHQANRRCSIMSVEWRLNDPGHGSWPFQDHWWRGLWRGKSEEGIRL